VQAQLFGQHALKGRLGQVAEPNQHLSEAPTVVLLRPRSFLKLFTGD